MKTLLVVAVMIGITACGEVSQTFTSTADVEGEGSKYTVIYEVHCHTSPSYPTIHDVYGELGELSDVLSLDLMQTVLKTITATAIKTCNGDDS